jgi:hypothetical protein
MRKPSWLVPGAKVLVMRGQEEKHATQTTIDRVYDQYYTVVGSHLRFSVDFSEGDSNNPLLTRVIPLIGDEVRELTVAARQRRLVDKACQACDRWIKSGKRHDRLIAIAALQAVED